MRTTPKRLLVVRFSSLGDVLLTVPVLQYVLRTNPDVELFVLTKQAYATIFQVLERTTVCVINAEGWRLFTFYNDIIQKYKIDAIIDLHQVLRTYILKLVALFRGVPFFSISKNRWIRKRFLKYKNTIVLPSIWKLYSAPFIKAGLLRDANIPLCVIQDKLPKDAIIDSFVRKQTQYIAIAPFAYYKEKIYPLAQMENLLAMLSKRIEYTFLLLGKGEYEESIINQWTAKYKSMVSICDLDLLTQLRLLTICKAALVMDSANLHLAGLANVPKIIALFGATSPNAGFSVWQNTQAISTKIACRPCSIFGNKPCSQTSFKCMEAISSIQVFNALID